MFALRMDMAAVRQRREQLDHPDSKEGAGTILTPAELRRLATDAHAVASVTAHVRRTASARGHEIVVTQASAIREGQAGNIRTNQAGVPGGPRVFLDSDRVDVELKGPYMIVTGGVGFLKDLFGGATDFYQLDHVQHGRTTCPHCRGLVRAEQFCLPHGLLDAPSPGSTGSTHTHGGRAGTRVNGSAPEGVPRAAVTHVFGVLELPVEGGVSSAFGPAPNVGPKPHYVAITSNSSAVELAVTPATLYSVYNMTGADTLSRATTVAFFRPTGLGLFPVVNFDPDALQAFAATYMAAYAPVSLEYNHSARNSPEWCNSTNASEVSSCTEPNLDAQYLAAAARGATVAMEDDAWLDAHVKPTVGWWSGNPVVDYVMLRMLHDVPLPAVLSISYVIHTTPYLKLLGFNATQAIVKQFDSGYEALALAGMTTVVASGDKGAAGLKGQCDLQFDTNLLATVHSVVVGATQFGHSVGSANNSRIEVAQSIGDQATIKPSLGSSITTGGGFSAFEPTPNYQAEAVASYLATISNASFPQSGLYPVVDGVPQFDPKGRGFPDVSLVGRWYRVYANAASEFGPVDGTSASAPVVAGMLAVLKDARRKAGKSVPTMMTQLLYQVAAVAPNAFYDMTVGDNRCMNLGETCCAHGFQATKGWDAVTGLGTINFGRLKEAVLALE